MDIVCFSFDHVGHQVEPATRPLARLVMHLPLSLVVAGLGLLPPRFAPQGDSDSLRAEARVESYAAAARPDAQSGTPNYGFQV